MNMIADPVADLMRQGALDFSPTTHVVEPPAPSRLLIMACSDTKAKGEGLAAKSRYNGPLWQTLRAVDPTGAKASVAYLSARYGLGDATKPMPLYNQRLTAAAAAVMKDRGLGGWHPYRADLPTTAGGLRNWTDSREALQTPAGEMARMLRRVPSGAFSEVAVCGGKLYVDVALGLIQELRDAGWIAQEASVTVINDQIGFMRSQLKAWLMREAADD